MNAPGIAGITGTAVDVRFWAWWLAASTLGGLVALAMAAELPWGVGAIPSGDPANVEGYSVAWAVVLGGLLAGATLGGFQWLLLRRWFSSRPGEQSMGWWWVAASAIGFAVSFTAAWAISGRVHGAEYAYHGLPHAVDRAATWGGLLIGAMFSGAQWLVLRARGTEGRRRWSGWWMPVSTVSFVAGWWIAALASAPVEAALGPMTHFWGGAVFGVVFGVIAGSALAWLSRGASFPGSV